MSLRFGAFYEGGRYHVFNRATEGREIFTDWRDLERFCDLLELVSTEERIVSVQAIKKGDINDKIDAIKSAQRLVTIEAFSILPNHFHLLLKQECENGVARFMQKLLAGYSKYFNTRYNRSGRLWMGTYKYIEIESDDDYLRVGSYVSRNHEVHNFTDTVSPLRTNSSYGDMVGITNHAFCDSAYLLESFGGVANYMEISREVIDNIKRMRESANISKEEKNLLLED